MRLGLSLVFAAVCAAQTLSVSPSQLNFAAQPGGTPTAPQYVTISSPVPVQIVAQAADWLRIDSDANRLSVVADPSALELGKYEAKLLIRADNQPTREVAVFLNVSRDSQLVVSRGALELTIHAGEIDGEREISVTSTSEPIDFTARVRGPTWLAL